MRSITFAVSLVLVFMIPWEGTVRLAGGTTGAAIVGAVLGLSWLILVVTTRRLRLPHRFHVVMYFFVLWNAISVLWSERVGSTAGQVVTWAQIFLFVYILWDLYRTRESVLAALQAFVLGVYVAIGGAIINLRSDRAFYTHYERFSPGTDVNPDGFGFIIALGIPMAWYLAVHPRPNGSVLWRFVNYGYIPTAFLGLALAGTRTALIASIPGMAFGLFSLTRLTLRIRISAFLVLLAAIGVMLPFVQPLRSFQRFGTTYTEITEGDLNNRIPNWEEGLESFVQHPVLGVGSGTYRLVNTRGKVAHNSFLSVLAEVGLVGLVLFGGVLAIAVSQAKRHSKFDARFWLSLLVVWAIGASTLSFQDRKSTWLIVSLAVISANVFAQHRVIPREEHSKSVSLVKREVPTGSPQIVAPGSAQS